MTWLQFLLILCLTETDGRPNPVDGDGGRSVGPYQISQPYLIDSGTGYSHADMRDKAKAEETIAGYMRRYAPKNATAETLARIHVGGPNWRNVNTDKYMKRFTEKRKEAGI